MDVQSLLFSRADGWTVDKAKAWAKSHGYKHGKADVTDQYIRIRQFDPKGFKVIRTIMFGNGIRAVVARAGTPRKAAMKRKRKRAPATKATRSRRRTRRARETVAETPRRRTRRRTRRVAARRRAPSGGHMMEARRPRRRTRRKARRVHAWRGDSAGHTKAARKGWRRKRSAPKRRKRAAPRRRRAREAFAYEARRPRRHRRRARSTYAYEARRPRRRLHRRRMHEARGGAGLSGAEFAMALVSGGFGFVLADALDRFLATYNPAGTTVPTDKFTSQGTGTLANTLNVASTPNWKRVAAGVGTTALPAIASMFTDSPMLRSSFEGMALGAGVKAFSLLWNNLLMPALRPKDAVSMQKSIIARLYPAEITAATNLAAKQTAAPAGTSFGALSAPPPPPAAGVGAPDVGPFALANANDDMRPSAADVLRRAAGVSDYPSAADVLRQQAGMADYPSVADALRRQAGVSYQPAGPPEGGTGPQANPHTDPACGCIGDDNQFLGFIGDAEESPLYMDGSKANGKAA
jgi:hypothetical protein